MYGRQKSMKGGRCTALNQYYKSIVSDGVFSSISTKLNINGNVCEIADESFGFINKHRKIKENENDSQSEDYRGINKDEKTKSVHDKLSELTIYNKIKNLDLNEIGLEFVATCLYPFSMWAGKPV